MLKNPGSCTGGLTAFGTFKISLCSSNMSSKPFKPSRLSHSQPPTSEASDGQKPPLPPTVTFGRRTSSGRYISYSRDDLDSELGSSDFMNYTVHMPQTPDNQPMDPSISQKVEEQYVSSSLLPEDSTVLLMPI
ncbi:hypothetical protein ACSQ67_022074 [Phaseolus vulgaris]